MARSRLFAFRSVSAAVASAALILTVAPAAFADPAFTGGTQSCAQTEHGVARGYTTGTTVIDSPDFGTNNQTFYNGTTPTVRLKHSSYAGGGYWKVTTSNILYSGSAYCAPGTP